MTLSIIAIEEKNKLATDSKWLVALKITIPGVTDPVRLVRDNSNMTWQGETWVAFPFEIEEIGDDLKGEIPQVNVQVSNISRVMEAYISAYDTYCKNNGYSDIDVNLYVVNSKNLADSTAEAEYEFILKSPATDSRWATFILGASNPFRRRFPQGRILKNHCRFRFKDLRCQYAGVESTCNKTLARCRQLSNSANFGGFPGVGYGGLIIQD